MNPESNLAPHEPKPASLARFVGYFLRLGTFGFGGPIALAGHMQQDLVDERGWIRKEDYLEGLALAQLAPGPLAAQLAIYLGYVRAGLFGATAVGVAFVLPSFLMVLGLSAAYVRFGGLPWMQGMFYGIGAAVIGIIARSAFKLTKLTIGKDKLLWGIFSVLAVSTAWTSQEIIWLFLLGGVVNLLARAFPARLPAGARSHCSSRRGRWRHSDSAALCWSSSVTLRRQDCSYSVAVWPWCHFSTAESCKGIIG